MKFSCVQRVLCFVLTTVFLFETASALTGWFSYSYPIGQGTTYSRQEGYNESGVQKASIITYTPNESVSPIGVRSGKQFYGSRKTISQISSSLEEQGYDVIGGINADFFSFSDGTPTGLFVENGRLIAATDWESAIGFMKDGSAIIGDPIDDIIISGQSGKIVAFDYNKTRTKRGLYLLDYYYSDETHFASSGQSIIMEYDDPSILKIGQPITLTVVNKVSGDYSFPIAQNQMILTRRDDCVDMPWVDFQIGEKITIDFKTNDARWTDVVYAVGGKKLITNGEVTTKDIDSATSLVARSAAGIKADGTVVLYQVDGAQPNYSKGLTAVQLASELKQLGCVYAVCLDGGGSSAMTIKNPINEKSITITNPSNGSERKCSTYIFLVNNAQSDKIPSSLHLQPESNYVLQGGKVPFTTTVLDKAFKKTTTDEQITYTSTLGSVNNNIFTAPLQNGAVTINAETQSGLKGQMQIYVTDEPTSMSIYKDGKAVSSVSTTVGESIQLDAVMFRNGIKVISSNDQITWSVSDEMGTIKSGLFTPTKAGNATIYASRYGVSKSITVKVGVGKPQDLQLISNFEDDNQPFTSSEDISLYLTDKIEDVARGYNSLVIDYSNSDLQLTLSPSPAPIQNEKFITLLAKTKSGSGNLEAVFYDENNNEIISKFDKELNQSYQFFTAQIPQNAVNFVGIRLANGYENGIFYIDHIVLSMFPATNSDAPFISINEKNINISENLSATVYAVITQNSKSSSLRENNIKAYLNGEKIDLSYDIISSTATIKTGPLKSGTYVLIIEAEDDAGNLSREIVTINCGNKTNSKFIDVSNSWSTGYINLLSDRGIMNGSKVSNDKWKFNPKNNLKRSEFAVIMSNILKLNTSEVTQLPFADADKIPSWAKQAVCAVYNEGIMTGQASKDKINFNPNAQITRAEVMTVISRCLPRGYVNKNMFFADSDKIPSWAKQHVNYVTSVGIINGYNDKTIKPTANITREEIASVICKFK